MNYNQDSKTMFFDIQERIPLGEDITDVLSVQNVEVTPQIEMIAESFSYRIKGFLNFTGEFEGRRNDERGQGTKETRKNKLLDAPALEPFLLEKSASSNKKLLKSIEHHIPVDITLPADRVDEEVVLEVVSLDYELVEPSYLLVTAKISLEGIRQDDIFSPPDERPQYTVETNAYWGKDSEIDFEKETLKFYGFDRNTSPQKQGEEGKKEIEFDGESQDWAIDKERKAENELEQNNGDERSNHEEDQEQIGDIGKEEIVTYSDSPSENKVSMNKHFDHTETDGRESFNQEFIADEVPLQNIELVGLERESDRESDREVKVSITNKQHKQGEGLNERTDLTRTDLTEVSGKSAAHKNGGENSEKRKHSEEQKKTVDLLSKFLASREETFTQMKLYLVQPGESLQDIARRYSISEQEIQEVNQLGFNQHVSGKLIRIPVRSQK